MGLLGATVSPVEAGTRTLKEATSEAISATGSPTSRRTHYIIGSCVGPAPYPAMVRDLQRVNRRGGARGRSEREGRLPDRVIACVGGGLQRDRDLRCRFVEDAAVALIGVEAAGRARVSPPRGAPLTGGRAARRPARLALGDHVQDDDGQVTEAHSISAGLDNPGVGPEHAHLRDSPAGRPTTPSPTPRHSRRCAGMARLEGHHPGARVPRTSDRSWRVAAREPLRLGARPHLPVGPRGQGPRGGPGPDGLSACGAGRRDPWCGCRRLFIEHQVPEPLREWS